MHNLVANSSIWNNYNLHLTLALYAHAASVSQPFGIQVPVEDKILSSCLSQEKVVKSSSQQFYFNFFSRKYLGDVGFASISSS